MSSEREAAPASLIEVAVALPVPGTFTYALPQELVGAVQVGSRVLVPFGRRGAVGFVVGTRQEAPEGVEVKPVKQLMDETSPLDLAMLKLLLWAAEYYSAPPGEMIRAALPAGTQSSAGRRVRLRLDAACEGPAPSTKQARLLELLRQAPEGELDEEWLRRTAGGAAAAAALADLEADGFIERVDVAQAPRVGVRREPFFTAGRAPTPEEQVALGRAPRRAQVLERIVSAPAPVGKRELRDIPSGLAHARGLAALGLLRAEQREIVRDPFRGAVGEEPAPPTLNEHQATAVAALCEALSTQTFSAHLLHGVTSSGKTEVYLRVIARARAQGQSAIVLVPEISLTPQLAARFRARFGDDVAVLHSGLSDGERFDAWRRLRDGQVGIALGARSAVFAPVRDLGIIAVDEEHDPSFKQEEGTRYHARDLALVRAQQAGAICVLGSATPALESYHNATEGGRLRLLELPERARAQPLPEVEIIDLRKHRPDKEGLLSARLVGAVAETLAAGEQSILFLNRRGFATFLLCRGCGHALRCADCSVTLTFHRSRGAIACHYCGFAARRPDRCPKCHDGEVAELGVGTERVEAVLKERFPAARVARLDRDTGSGPGLRRLLDAMARREVDILVGTQMVTKGHDFPAVTLVGVVLADTGLHFPDFRAGERTFQLLAQVAGRAGRGDRPGRVLIQTYNPSHPAIVCAQKHDYLAFAAQELAARRELGYPPFGRLIALRIDGKQEGLVRQVAQDLARSARAHAARLGESAPAILGPAEAPIARIRGRTRWQLLLRGPSREPLRQVLRRVMAEVQAPGTVRVVVDVDPMSTL